MRLYLATLPLAFTLLIATSATAQLEKVGFWATSFKNPTSNGSRDLTVQVHYPASSAGNQTPLKKVTGGWPVVVFLHGYTAPASLYAPMANYVSARGYVVVICDTGRTNTDVEAADGIALYFAVASENAKTNGFFKDALDTKRIGLSGHSMGGGNTIRVLASNPGYLCGVPLAPWDHKLLYNRDYPKTYAHKVTVPLAIVYGQGDAVLDWRQGVRFYDLATAYDQLKTLYMFNKDGDHNNVAGYGLLTAADRAVFARTMAWLVGFMDTYVKKDTSGLEHVVGLTARSDTRLVMLLKTIDDTELWLTGDTKLASTFRMHALAKPGPVALAVGVRSAPVNTVFGPLVLNSAAILILSQAPASKDCLQTTPITIPNNPALRGLGVTFQALGQNTAGALKLTGGVDARVK